jgi:predicted TIM-barrel fold metal-dependent hydrolase
VTVNQAPGFTPRERALIVSSDGHATAKMRDYRPYVDPAMRAEFDSFCSRYDEQGMTTVNPKSLANRIDPELVQQWIDTVLVEGRVEGQWDANRRLKELDREGISGEVIFPDFGLPFELHPPLVAAIVGYQRTPEQVEAANRAYNRWLVDFCSTAPDRMGGLAVLSFADPDATVEEIRWAKQAGLKGIVLPAMNENMPLFDKRYEPVWSVLEELGLPVCTHTAISSITDHLAPGTLQAVPHPACALPIMTAQAYFFCQQILTHMIWGGVLERHPDLHMVLTEQGSGWVISALRGMDYSWEQSYLRRDVREVVKRKPSEYFRRQVHMGSSLFSLAEAEARHEIGVDKILIGADYPHHEGTWGAGPGTAEYLQATLGAAGVPVADARSMLGGNAIDVFHFDADVLGKQADTIGTELDILLTPPTREYFPRGDVNKPLATAF